MTAQEQSTDTSTVEIIDELLSKAIQAHASDIHIESIPQGLRVRFRIDSVLYDHGAIPRSLSKQIISRIKILAHMDIAEKRVPHDGKFRIQINGHDIDLRVSTFPSIYGETIVIRILDRSATMIALNNIGMQEKMLAEFMQLVNRHHGFFLVTGPTGSGKTTTLYATLALLNTAEKNIITLEDPVEYNIEGITQGQIFPEVGFTFARGIRSMLRQDPDVVMIGEIRDQETARTAVEAALSGHIVLSTLHTNDAPGTIMRLMDMGIESFLINAAVTGVLAQRLARKLCKHCIHERVPTQEEQIILEKINLPIKHLREASGCDQCFNLGYKGRIGIFELLILTDALRSRISHHPIMEEIYEQAYHDGMQSLLADAKQKVQQGIISLSELVRVVL